MVLNHNLDTTSLKKTKRHLTNLMKTVMEEMGLSDIWKGLHPQVIYQIVSVSV